MLKRLLSLAAFTAVTFFPASVLASSRTQATFYSDYFNGRRTASGEVFSNWGGYTAASNYYPIGSYVRVTNRYNGRSVVVRINDRCGSCGIDLSKAAFTAIGDLNAGVLAVDTWAE